MNSLHRKLGLAFAAALICFCAATQIARADDHVITGTIDKVDTGAKTVSIKTADGTVHAVKWTDDTTVDGLKKGAHGADLVGKEGGHVIVRTTDEGADTVAHSFTYVGHETVKTADVTVDDVGKSTKTVAVHTAYGTKDTFKVADHATVDTGKDVEKGGHYTVYYTQEGGKKVVHFFSHL
jgi:hypothetical protein